ncbi:MAG: hypothetical protein ACOWYE_05060 [Desulfatiglandales bacterium]
MYRILLLELDSAMQLLLTDELNEEGYHVLILEGSPRILEIIAGESPDLVIIGLVPGLPEGPLVKIIEEIRDKGIPVFSLKADLEQQPCGRHTDYAVLGVSKVGDLKKRVHNYLNGNTDEKRGEEQEYANLRRPLEQLMLGFGF